MTLTQIVVIFALAGTLALIVLLIVLLVAGLSSGKKRQLAEMERHARAQNGPDPTSVYAPAEDEKEKQEATWQNWKSVKFAKFCALLLFAGLILTGIFLRVRQIPWGEISGTESMLFVSQWAWHNWAAIFSLLGIGFTANWLVSLRRCKSKEETDRQEKTYKQVKSFLIGAMAVIFIGLPVTGTVVNFFNPDPSEVPATCPPMGYVDQTCVVTHVFSHPFGLLATVVIPQGAAPIPIMSTRGSGLAVAINGGGPNLWKLRATNQKSVEVTYRLPRPGQGI